jgi:hypothetical protein
MTASANSFIYVSKFCLETTVSRDGKGPLQQLEEGKVELLDIKACKTKSVAASACLEGN